METQKLSEPKTSKERRRLGKGPVALLLAGSVLFAATSGNDAAPTSTEQAIPVEQLVNIIEDLEQGGSVQVTSEAVVLPGAIGDTQGRPMVIEYDGKKAFAYKQGSELNFDKDPETLAGQLAVVPVPENENIDTVEAVISKGGDLSVGLGGRDEVVVGYAFPEAPGK